MWSPRMGRKFDKHHILRQKDPWVVARNAFEVALEFALLGHVDKATELFVVFHEFAPEAKAAWSPGLYFAWEATASWPRCIPANERSPEFLKKLETERIVWKRETNQSQAGLDKLIAIATGASHTNAWDEHQVRPDDLTAALDLALFMNEKGKAHELLQAIANNWHECHTELPKSRQAWRLLKDQALARAIGINETKLDTFYTEVLTTFTQRLENGATRVFKDVPTPTLVHKCNENTLKNAVWEEMHIDPQHPPSTILRPGATPADLAACEARLGHALPDDVRDFLRTTNGMGGVWNGFHGEPAFLSTADIHIVDASAHQAEWEAAAVDIVFVTAMSVRPAHPRFTRAIAMNEGAEDSRFVWLVSPEVGREMGSAFFAAVAKLPEAEQKRVKTMLGYWHKGIETSAEIGWQVCVWCPSELSLVMYHSFKEYLEELAGDAASEDMEEEVDAEGRPVYSGDVFAYLLR